MARAIDILDAEQALADYRKRTRKLGVQTSYVRGKKVGGGRKLAPDNPVPFGKSTTTRVVRNPEVLKAHRVAQAAARAAAFAQEQAEMQRKLRIEAQKELRRLLRNLEK